MEKHEKEQKIWRNEEQRVEIVLLHYETDGRKRAGQVESFAKSICGAFRSLSGQCERNLNGSLESYPNDGSIRDAFINLCKLYTI